jgi:hypothetical protein
MSDVDIQRSLDALVRDLTTVHPKPKGLARQMINDHVALVANEVIGQDVEVSEHYATVMDEKPTQDKAQLAINQTKAAQRGRLYELQKGK